MKKLQYFSLLFALIIFYSCNRIKNETKYKYADLLFRYINEVQKNKIKDNDYSMLILRSKYQCNSCYRISIDSALNIAINKTNNRPLYVLFDEDILYNKESKKYGDKINCLFDDKTKLDAYGLTNSYPLLFHIEKNCLKEFDKIIR